MAGTNCDGQYHSWDSQTQRDCHRAGTRGDWSHCDNSPCPNRYEKPYTGNSGRFFTPEESQVQIAEPSAQTATPPVSTMATTTPSMPSEALKIFIPSSYDGTNPVDANRFIAQCVIWFKKAKITDANDQIGEALALMKGRAMTWATPHIVDWADDKLEFKTWKDFEAAFKAQFGNTDDGDKAVGELGRLCRRGRNTRTVADYAIEFENISNRTALELTDLYARFKEGLPDRIKKALAISGRGRDSLPELKKAALHIDQNLIEMDENEQRRFFKKQKRQGEANVSASFSTPSSFSGNCFRCGKPGHRKFECPEGKGKGRARVAASNVAEPSTSSSSSSEISGLLEQIKTMREELGQLRALRESENF